MGDHQRGTIPLHDGAVDHVLIRLLRFSELLDYILTDLVDPFGHHLLRVLLAQQHQFDALADGCL
jgi:hypothetical protein